MRKLMSVAVLTAVLLIPLVASAATEIVYWDFIKPGDGTPRGLTPPTRR